MAAKHGRWMPRLGALGGAVAAQGSIGVPFRREEVDQPHLLRLDRNRHSHPAVNIAIAIAITNKETTGNQQFWGPWLWTYSQMIFLPATIEFIAECWCFSVFFLSFRIRPNYFSDNRHAIFNQNVLQKKTKDKWSSLPLCPV